MKQGYYLETCSEHNCCNDNFRLFFELSAPMVECRKCGKRFVLVDAHTRLPVASKVALHTCDDDVAIRCYDCNGTGFSGSAPCSTCDGKGKLDLGTDADRKARSEKRLKEMNQKDLDPEK